MLNFNLNYSTIIIEYIIILFSNKLLSLYIYFRLEKLILCYIFFISLSNLHIFSTLAQLKTLFLKRSGIVVNYIYLIKSLKIYQNYFMYCMQV
jgi:hypothetical protein